MELFTLQISDQPVGYYSVSKPWRRYDVLALLFVTTLLVLLYYTGWVLNGFADDKTCLYAIALTEYVFLADKKFVTNAKDGSLPAIVTKTSVLAMWEAFYCCVLQ